MTAVHETFLTPPEIEYLTGVKMKKAQIQILRQQSIPFFINALGKPVVPRSALFGTPKPKDEGWQPAVFQAQAGGNYGTSSNGPS